MVGRISKEMLNDYVLDTLSFLSKMYALKMLAFNLRQEVAVKMTHSPQILDFLSHSGHCSGKFRVSLLHLLLPRHQNNLFSVVSEPHLH